MLRSLVLSLLAVVLFASGSASAQPSAVQATGAENVAQAPDMGPTPKAEDPKICRRVATTGSRVGGERVCKTAAEWQQEAKDNQEAAKNMSKVRGATKGQ
jgi:hypothetical protein